MQGTSDEERLEAVVAQLKSVRKAYEDNVSEVSPEVANNNSEWSIADLLRHVNADRHYRNLTNRLLEEDSPQLGSYDPVANLRRLLDGSLAHIDEALSVAAAVTPAQLTRTGTRRGQAFAVIDSLEAWANHFDEHLAQLRDEIRPREGLPEVH